MEFSAFRASLDLDSPKSGETRLKNLSVSSHSVSGVVGDPAVSRMDFASSNRPLEVSMSTQRSLLVVALLTTGCRQIDPAPQELDALVQFFFTDFSCKNTELKRSPNR